MGWGGQIGCFWGRESSDANEISLSGCQGKHALAASANIERRMGSLLRVGVPLQLGDLVVLSGKGDRFLRKKAFDERECLCEARNTHSWPVKRYAYLYVILSNSSTAQTTFNTPIRKNIEHRYLLGQERGMPDIHIQDIGSYA